jgi:hypothetical protein
VSGPAEAGPYDRWRAQPDSNHDSRFTIHDSRFTIELMPTRTQLLGLLILMAALVVYVFLRVL